MFEFTGGPQTPDVPPHGISAKRFREMFNTYLKKSADGGSKGSLEPLWGGSLEPAINSQSKIAPSKVNA